jgi:UDP-2,3-diacylglucosamine hydrolase
LGKIAEISDSGIPVHYFTGNHDMWAFGYFEKELGVKIYRSPVVRKFNKKILFIGHGDGLGPGDLGYKFLKKIFSNKICQVLFSWLHPGIGTSIALYFSKKSRIANGAKDEIFLGEEKERLITFCKQSLKSKLYHFFIFGHRHLPVDIKVGPESRYINIGDWVKSYSYAVFDGNNIQIKYFQNED